MGDGVRAIEINLAVGMSAWLRKLLMFLGYLIRVLRGHPLQLPPAPAYPWDTCSDCFAPLPDRVHRLMDASYCQPCHEEREAAMD